MLDILHIVHPFYVGFALVTVAFSLFHPNSQHLDRDLHLISSHRLGGSRFHGTAKIVSSFHLVAHMVAELRLMKAHVGEPERGSEEDTTCCEASLRWWVTPHRTRPIPWSTWVVGSVRRRRWKFDEFDFLAEWWESLSFGKDRCFGNVFWNVLWTILR